MKAYELIANFTLNNGNECQFIAELSDLIAKHGVEETSRMYRRGAGERIMLKNELIDEIARLNAKVAQLEEEVIKWHTVAKSKRLR